MGWHGFGSRTTVSQHFIIALFLNFKGMVIGHCKNFVSLYLPIGTKALSSRFQQPTFLVCYHVKLWRCFNVDVKPLKPQIKQCKYEYIFVLYHFCDVSAAEFCSSNIKFQISVYLCVSIAGDRARLVDGNANTSAIYKLKNLSFFISLSL